MNNKPEKESRSKVRPEEPLKYQAQRSVAATAAREVQVRPLDLPPTITKAKPIHPRRLLPFVAEGKERPFHSMNTRAIIHDTEDAATDIKVVLNTPLSQPAQNRTASNVGEPSVSINGETVFYTGNWYAAMSDDGGQTFKFVDPNDMAQPGDPQGVTFCCDQVVNYLPSIDTFVWLLQYGPSTGDNIQRLAFAKTADVKAGKWRIFDITTGMLEVAGFFMDFPDLAVGKSFLYMTTNCFGADNKTVGSAVVRIPFNSIDQGKPSVEKFVSMDLFAFRVAQNCADTAYFAAHRDTSTIAVFSWPENQPAPSSQDVAIARWIGTNGYISRMVRDGRRWLDRADPRMTGATLAGDELWFAWGVDADSNHRAKPFVQMARLDSKDMSLIEDVNLFDPDSAICYAGLSTNVNNEVGVSYMIGGGEVFPSHVVGFLSGSRKSVIVGNGTRSPVPDSQGHFEWGDYLTARPVFPARKLFAAAGYTFLGNQDGGNLDATPRFVIFGRSADASDLAVGGRGSDAAGGASGEGDGGNDDDVHAAAGPIKDVNKLKTVTPAVAAKIKAACGVHAGVLAAPQPLPALPELVTKPGKERWAVKTGQDPDRDAVGKNIINGQTLGAGIVPVTVEELISMPRPAGLEVLTADPPQFQNKRAQPVETTIWRVEGTVTALKLEADGDYHLVLEGASGATMVAEVPTPTKTFVGDSPWLANIKEARQAVDDKLVHNLNPHDFVLPPGATKLVPRSALSGDFPIPALANFKLPDSFVTQTDPEALPIPTFQTAVKPTATRITGIGFFDRAHGATGAAPNVIELHTVLKIEFL
jgi:hypothetical protein